jgi:hypothetical protein
MTVLPGVTGVGGGTAGLASAGLESGVDITGCNMGSAVFGLAFGSGVFGAIVAGPVSHWQVAA